MLDIETAGKSANAMILSIGGAVFNADKGVIYSFHVLPNLDEQRKEAREVDIDTILWWMEQSEGARREAFFGPRTERGNVRFKIQRVWYDHEIKEVWAHGASFDITILESYFQTLVPWSFREISDTRVLGKYIKVDRPAPTIPHHAECDAIAQAEWATAMLRALNCA